MTKFIKTLSVAERQAATEEIVALLKKKYPNQVTPDINLYESDITEFGADPERQVSPQMQQYLDSKKKQ